MPSIVPPGFTRGPILYIGHATTHTAEARLLQTFWDLAGGYGARLALIDLDPAGAPVARRMEALLAEWEADSVVRISLRDRGAASAPGILPQIERSTGILLISTSVHRAVATLGGTDLAQAIRRKNARNTTVCGMGEGGMLVCQHIAWTTSTGEQTGISFLPGLGLINRLTILPFDQGPAATEPRAKGADDSVKPGRAVDAGEPPPAQEDDHVGVRLAHIVAHNPFLIAAAVPADAGLAVFPDSTLQRFGQGPAIVVQQHDLTPACWTADGLPIATAQAGATRITGDSRYSMDTHTLIADEGLDDIPGESYSTSAF